MRSEHEGLTSGEVLISLLISLVSSFLQLPWSQLVEASEEVLIRLVPLMLPQTMKSLAQIMCHDDGCSIPGTCNFSVNLNSIDMEP